MGHVSWDFSLRTRRGRSNHLHGPVLPPAVRQVDYEFESAVIWNQAKASKYLFATWTLYACRNPSKGPWKQEDNGCHEIILVLEASWSYTLHLRAEWNDCQVPRREAVGSWHPAVAWHNWGQSAWASKDFWVTKLCSIDGSRKLISSWSIASRQDDERRKELTHPWQLELPK